MTTNERLPMEPYLLLDAGGTLLFPNHEILGQVLGEHGYRLSDEQLKYTIAQCMRHYDESLKTDGQAPFGFYEWILEHVGVSLDLIPPITKQLHRLDAQSSLWNYTYSWAYEVLARLRAQGYRISVISNADGRVEQELKKAGLAPYFDKVFDSHVVGYAKPDVRLFQHALKALGLRPEQCIYVGDVYYIDVLGANRSGIAAVHLDAYGLYEGWPGFHLPSVAVLPSFLEQGLDLSDERFFPLRK